MPTYLSPSAAASAKICGRLLRHAVPPPGTWLPSGFSPNWSANALKSAAVRPSNEPPISTSA